MVSVPRTGLTLKSTLGLVAVVVAAGCASSEPWYWSNRLDPQRPVDGDQSRCALTAYQAAQQSSGMQAVIVQQLEFENCMATAGWVKYSGVAPSPSPPSVASPNVSPPPPALEARVDLVGGENHATYLGCISCPHMDPESIFNAVGSYGSPVSQTSISNPLSPYGSPVSRFSACNPVASAPPVLIDTSRRLLGVLTLNRTIPGALTDPAVVSWLRSVCATGG